MKRRGFIEIKNPQFINIVAALVSSEYNLPMPYATFVVTNAIKPFVGIMRDDISVYFETEYVDKVYRDSYYRYYSSKASKYPRDCIRLSFFCNSAEIFGSGTIFDYSIDDIRNLYRGFLVLRPTVPNIVGRSAISPKALKDNNFNSCLVDIKTTVDGIKVNVSAFPSSSQDAESITCAETSLWALMEYYGNKYPEYTPIKLSNVIEALRENVVDRQLPSHGLSAECLTYAIKSFGFGPRLYHAGAFLGLNNILGCYIESGIPIVVALSNRNAVSKGSAKAHIGHAVLCIGHEIVTEDMIDAAYSCQLQNCANVGGRISVLDYDDIKKRFVFIDDNLPPYQMDFLSTPANRYADPNWCACTIESIIAPLYGKIYMEPFIAKEYVRTILRSRRFSHLCGKTVVTRTYLCSTRSYRDYVRASSMANDMKRFISSIFMPKFVWVTELSDISSFKAHEVDSLILLDATALQKEYYEPLLSAFVDNKCYFRDRETNTLCKM